MFRNRIIVTIAAALTVAGAFPYTASAQMTEDQIVEYIKESNAAGKSQNQVARELLAKGVKTGQLQSIKNKYDSMNDIKSRSLGQSVSSSNGGRVNVSSLADDVYENSSTESAGFGGNSAVMSRNGGNTGGELERNFEMFPSDSGAPLPVYGHNLFNSKNLSFEPNDNLATPANYKLGPGDQIAIDVWGNNEANIVETISQEGRIFISQIGPIYLGGLTIDQASSKIRKLISQKYSGIDGSSAASGVSVTLAKVRTIQVNVMGDINVPGTYRLSAFSTLFNAVYRAGGISNTGSLRQIQLVRGGKTVATVDLYDYLFNGTADDAIRLEDGDVIKIPPYRALASINGYVKRPMAYEITGCENLNDLLEYSGGFTSDAYESEVKVIRKTGKEYRIHTVNESEYRSFVLQDGDAVTVGKIINRYENRVEVKGSVFRPGQYELGGGIATVRQLIEHASGLTEDAYLDRAIIVREREDLSLEVKPVCLSDIMNGKTDELLRKNDVVLISNKREMEDLGTVSVVGFVNQPGEFPFAANTSVKDAILQAGGLLYGASVAKIDVARRINNPESLEASELQAETFTFSFVDGGSEEADNFILEPFDIVIVHKNPDFRVQEFVSVEGEVAFEGDYVLTSNQFRLSDLVAACGGITRNAYPHGARLIRHMTSDEIATHTATLQMISDRHNKDSIKVDDRMLSATYTVGINLEKAMKNKGSVYDVVLREGDKLVVPQYNSTVKIQGAIMYPNTVSYLPNHSLHYYISQAGGYAYRAKKSGVYVVYMNGNVAKIHSGSRIEPGCEIVVPSKPEKKELSTSEILSIGTTAASLTTMIATIINLVK